MVLNKKLMNVLLLGLSFMLIFTAFQTMGNIQTTILRSIADEDKDFNGDGLTSLAIIYAMLSIFNWAAPSVISLIGPKYSMVFGGVTYLLFIMSFLLPKTWLLYLASAIIGTGAAMIWTGQGNYLSLNSTTATISRNSGIFWAMLQFSMFIGNVFVFFKFQGMETNIDKNSRTVVIWTLSGICVVGLVVMFLLPAPPKSENEVQEERGSKSLDALKEAFGLFWTKKMILLSITFIYTGVELSFFSGVYGTCLGATLQFSNSKELVGLSGVFVGIGEVIGGSAFGILGSKTIKWGRDPIVIAGFIFHIIGFFIIFINIPNSTPFGDTNDEAFITSLKELALFCSFLLGLGDACYNTQAYSILGGYFSKNSSAAFAIFKFTQSIAAAISFFYASHISLYGQLGVLLVLAIVGTISFVYVEWTIKTEAKNVASDSYTSSNESIADE